MIEVYKITHNIYDETVYPHLPFYARANTRGSSYKLVNHSFHYDLRKHFYSARIVNIWNSLPNSVVGCTKQLNMILKPTWLVPEIDQKKLQSDNVFLYTS